MLARLDIRTVNRLFTSTWLKVYFATDQYEDRDVLSLRKVPLP